MLDLNFVIKLIDSNFGTGIDKAKKEVGKLGDAVEQVNEGVERKRQSLKEFMSEAVKGLKPISDIIFGGFALPGLSEMAANGTKAFDKYKAAHEDLQSSFRSTGGGINRSVNDMVAQAKKLEGTTLFSASQTMEAESLLLQMNKITGVNFDSAIKSVQNYATKMGGTGPADLKGAAKTVGEALVNPIEGLKSLEKAGVKFSSTQTEAVKNMMKTNNLAGAQGVILGQLDKQFGGSAEAARNAQGPYGEYKDKIGSLEMAIGSIIGAIKKNMGPAFDAAGKAVGGVTTLLQNLANWMGQNDELVRAIAVTLGIVTGAFMVYNGVLALAAVRQAILNAVMTANPIGVIIVALAVVAGAFYYAYQKCDALRAVFSGIGSVVQALMPIFSGLGKIILGAFTFNPALMAEGFNQAYNGIKDIAKKGGISGVFKEAYNKDMAESAKKRALEEAEQKKMEAAANNKGKPVAQASGAALKTALPPAGGGMANTAPQPKRESVGGGSGGGRNITVIIQKLIGIENMSTTNIREGFSNAGDMIKEALIKSVRDSEIAISGE